MAEDQKEITVGRLEGKIDFMVNQLSECHKAIYGNGQSGIEHRLTQAEEKFIQITEERAKTRDDIKELVKSISSLEEIVEKHVEDDKIHSIQGLVLKKEVLVYIILIFVVLHSLIPDSLSVWELIRKFFGF